MDSGSIHARHHPELLGRLAMDVSITANTPEISLPAVTERDLAHMSKSFDRFDDGTIGANRGVAFAWQNGYRPMQRGASYGLDAAYLDSSHSALLRVYKWMADIWHGSLDGEDPEGKDAAGSMPSSKNVVRCDAS
jgi:hypothetical protein